MSKPLINILDRRGTGRYKTTDAITELKKEVENENVVVYVMLSYDNLSEISRQIDSQNVLIFKGRSHRGMCAAFEENRRLSKYIHVRNSCYDNCPHRVLCPYLLQIITAKGLKDLDKGHAILTVPRNLDQVLRLLGTKISLVIIDDYPISQVLLQEERINEEKVKAAIPYLEGLPTLTAVSKMLLDKDRKPGAIIKHIRSVKEAFATELRILSEDVEEDLKSDKLPPDLRYLFDLRYADRLVTNDPVDDEHIRIYSDLTEKLKKVQVRYLNATPSQADYEAMKRLGPYDEMPESSEPRDNWIVLQLNVAKYSRQSLLESEPLMSYINDVVSSLAKQLSFLGQRLIFMSKREANHQRFNKYIQENYPTLSVEYVDFFSDRSFGTNEYRNDKAGLIVGAPIKHPYDYCHLAYETLRRPTEEILADIERENEAKKPKAVYPVPKEVTGADERNSVIQMIGRVSRDGDDTTQTKIVILITDASLADETGYIPENGARVETFDSIEILLKRLKELVKEALVPQVLDRIYQEIDIRQFTGQKVGLSQVSKKYATLTGVSERIIRDALSNRYETYETMNYQQKKTTMLKSMPLFSPLLSIPATLFEKVSNSECLRENDVWPEILPFDLKTPLPHLWNVILADNCS